MSLQAQDTARRTYNSKEYELIYLPLPSSSACVSFEKL
jgi:hypothetical protein